MDGEASTSAQLPNRTKGRGRCHRWDGGSDRGGAGSATRTRGGGHTAWTSNPLGRVRLGEKGPKGEPKRLDHFRFTSASKELLESVAGKYGGTVKDWSGAPEEGHFELLTEATELDIVLPPVFSQADGTPTTSWSQWLELPPDEKMTDTIRRNTCTGRPSGSEAFISQLENRLSRLLRPQKRGRKPKLTLARQKEDFFNDQGE